MVRFLHSADWQMGMRVRGLGDNADQIRDIRFDTCRKIMKQAKEADVDFILLAGDIFEDNSVKESTVYQTINVLGEAAPIPIYIIPGNHDPINAASVYNSPAWNTNPPDNVTILREEHPVELEEAGVVLFPCPVTQKKTRTDPTEWIAADRTDTGDAVRIGIAHGSLDIHNRDYNFPISPDIAEKGELDYVALGDWHGRYIHNPGTAYSGTPEQTDFGEKNTGNILIVTIDQKGSEPDINQVPVNTLDWLTWDERVSDGKIEEIRKRITELDSPQTTLLKCSLQGAVEQEIARKIADLTEFANSLLFYADVDTDGIHLTMDPEELRHSLPPGALQDVCDVLFALDSSQDGAVNMTREDARNIIEELPGDVKRDTDTVQEAIRLLSDFSRQNT